MVFLLIFSIGFYFSISSYRYASWITCISLLGSIGDIALPVEVVFLLSLRKSLLLEFSAPIGASGLAAAPTDVVPPEILFLNFYKELFKFTNLFDLNELKDDAIIL